MRDLELNELQFVSGAGCAPEAPSGCGCSPSAPSKDKHKKKKGNNGYGNGGNDGSPNGKQDYSR